MIFRIAAFGSGALAMYYLDPVSGKRRRALARDKVAHYRKEARHRASGAVAEARTAVRRRLGERRPASTVDIDLSQQ